MNGGPFGDVHLEHEIADPNDGRRPSPCIQLGVFAGTRLLLTTDSKNVVIEMFEGITGVYGARTSCIDAS